LWWICKATVDFPEPMVPNENLSVPTGYPT
jgi:hypothetical protein